MVKQLNPEGKVVCTKAEPEWKVVNLSPSEPLPRFTTEPGMVKRLSPSGGLVCTKVESEWKMVKLSPTEELARLSTEAPFKPKIGSAIPAKRRSVKRMMFDYIVQSTVHVFRRRRRPSSSAAPVPTVHQGP